VFEQAGWIYRFDLATEKHHRVPIRILEDRASARGKLYNVPAWEVAHVDLNPDGSRALIGARGEVFSVPVKSGPTRNLTNSPGVHERNCRWSPDGKHIAFISDASGEDEIYLIAPDGSGPQTRLTTDGDCCKYQIRWSPDSKKILWS